MSNTENIYELIDRYLHNDMSIKEKELFEHRLSSDQELAQEFAEQKELQELIVTNELLDLDEEVKTFMQSKTQTSSRLWYQIGTSVLVISGLLGLWFFTDYKVDDFSSIEKMNDSEENNIEVLVRSSPLLIKNEKFIEVTESEFYDTMVIKKEKPFFYKDTIHSDSLLPKKSESRAVELPQLNKIPSITKNRDQEQDSRKDIEFDCEDAKKNLTITKTDPCFNQSNGSIKVDHPSDDFHILFREKEYFHVTEWTDLQAGNYSFTIHLNQCNWTEKVLLKEQTCVEEKQLVYSLSNNTEISFETELDGELSIYDLNNQLVFKEFKNAPMYWYGESNTGFSLQKGYYVFSIELENGNKIQGGLTILE